MVYNSLENYIRLNFALMQHHKYSLYDIEHMMPWERDSYVILLTQFIKEENERIQRQNQGSRVDL
jgi:hypothetical protein